MNCPGCGSLAYPRARKCHSCGTALAWPAMPLQQPTMHPLIAQRLRDLGFCRYADETTEQYRERCRRWVLDRFGLDKKHHDHAA